MANIVFNAAKGKTLDYHDKVATNEVAASRLAVILMVATEADATLADRTTVADVLAQGGNTEASFTSYARKYLTDADISASTVDNTGNTRGADMPDQVWTSATSGATLTKLIIAYDPDGTGTDANMIPLSCHDFSATTTGTDLTAQIAAAGYLTAA